MKNTANKNKYSSEIKSQYNSLSLEKELEWFQKILLQRGKITFEESAQEKEFFRIELPDLNNDPSEYANLVKKYDMGPEERVVLILSLIPHIRPSILDILNLKNQNFDNPFTEFGGIKAEKHKGFLPTGETAIFLLAGTDLEKRF
jgi:hypothetical protein